MGVTTVRGTLANRVTMGVLRRILSGNTLASFATVDARGHAHINTAYFAWSPDWDLFYYSYPDSRHSRNLARRQSMAVAVFDSHQRWGGADRGVQLFGTASEATGPWAERAAVVYARRFPRFETWKARTRVGVGEPGLRPYRFHPRRGKLFDERTLGSGRFVEVRIP